MNTDLAPFDQTRQTGQALWRARVAATPELPFLRFGERAWTYSEADAEMRAIAGALRSAGVGSGDRVIAGLTNSGDAVLTHIALRELSAVLIALVPTLTFDELAFQINHSEARFLVVDGSIATTVLPRLSELPGIETVLSPDELRSTDPVGVGALPAHDDGAPSAIFYTSGSTSKPKGVYLPAGSFFSCGEGYYRRFQVTPEDNYFLPFTVAHGMGGLVAPSMVMHAGAQLSIEERFRPSLFWQQVADNGSTMTLLFPAQLNILMELEASGPAPGESPLDLLLTHSWHEPFRDRFGVEIGLVWGMTEGGAMGAGTGRGYRDERDEGYVGPSLGDAELRVVNELGETLPNGQIGEVWIRHRHMMLEYLKEPEISAAMRAPGGWIRTGDKGELDDAGAMTYRGRIKNMVKRSGENISPEEIEGVLESHPDVVECVAFGVPDPMRTEELATVIVIKPESGVGPEALSEFVAERLAKWKAPRYVTTTIEPFPRLASGKTARVKVVALHDPLAAWDRERSRAESL